MPNWCWSKLSVTGPEQTVEEFVEAVKGPFCKYENEPAILDTEESRNYREQEHPLSFHQLVPVPEEVRKAGFSQGRVSLASRQLGNQVGGERRARCTRARALDVAYQDRLGTGREVGQEGLVSVPYARLRCIVVRRVLI